MKFNKIEMVVLALLGGICAVVFMSVVKNCGRSELAERWAAAHAAEAAVYQKMGCTIESVEQGPLGTTKKWKCPSMDGGTRGD